MSDDRAGIDRVFHALGDPTRRAILEALSERAHSISRLAEPLGLTLAAVVQHIQLLEEAGLVATEKVGRVRVCKLDPKGLALAAGWLQDRRSLWERRLDRLGDILGDSQDE
jgi:DNA-binding transcriptional ArsR family regulator